MSDAYLRNRNAIQHIGKSCEQLVKVDNHIGFTFPDALPDKAHALQIGWNLGYVVGDAACQVVALVRCRRQKVGTFKAAHGSMNLPVEEYKKAENLYNLVKMGRDPFGEEAASKRDFRWKGRYETWNLAKRFLEKYESGNLTVDDIIEIADKLGHWSVWFTVFKEHDEVRKNLIEHTSGTCTTCFDENSHYEPVCRERKV